MTSTPGPDPDANSPRPSRVWGWVVLAPALVAVGLIRVPLILNARAHLDSDLAVDGLTLLDASNDRWRWHYPATPFIGTPPVLLSWAQAKVWGVSPITLASGGAVAYGLIVAATFLLNRRVFGASVAAWGLVPLAFASTGTLWLSGRVTGGHLLFVSWHAVAFAMAWASMTRGGWKRSAALGLWCGLGLYVDAMFAVTWAGLAASASVFALASRPRFGRALACLLAFALAAGVGVAPRFVGQELDPHDAYVGQFDPASRPETILRNAGILAQECAPRLIAGHRFGPAPRERPLQLPRLQAEPATLPGGSPATPEKDVPWLAISVTVTSLVLFTAAIVSLFRISSPLPPGEGPGVRAGRTHPVRPESGTLPVMQTTLTPGPSPGGRGENDRSALASGKSVASQAARAAIRWGLLTSALAATAGFLIHPTITNSDNYRYLVAWLVPWSTGFGLLMARVASRRVWLAGALSLGFAVLMVADSARWYARFGWVDAAWMPVRKAVDDPALDWLDAHPDVSAIFGSYWDVYRLSFLAGGRVRGVPFGEFPQRFPENKANLPGAGHRVILVRPDGLGPKYRDRAMALGAREVGRARNLSIVEWPEAMSP